MEFLRDIFSLIGRVAISGTFLWACYERLTHWDGTVSYLRGKGVPQLNVTGPLWVGAKIAGALMVLLGWHAHFGALMLIAVSGWSAYFLHPFWKGGAGKEVEKALFMKDLVLIGGLFMILALGAGHFGIE
jgi:putative oxidoreductase